MEKHTLDRLLKKLADGSLLPEEADLLQEALEQEKTGLQDHLSADAWKDALNGPPPSVGEKKRAIFNYEVIAKQIQLEQLPVMHLVPARRWWHSAAFRAACIAGLILICGVIGYYLFPERPASTVLAPAVAWKQIDTRPGQRTRLTLGDGSVIFLNGGTSLKYPERFSGEKRQVELIAGEIFLEVQGSQAQPFLVRTDSLTVQVLGTSFTVTNRLSDHRVNVAVKTGRVSFATSGNSQQLLLTAGMEGVFKKQDGKMEERTVNTRAIAGWIRNEFVFENATLIEILTALEQSYGFHYQIGNQKAANKIFRASFNQHTPAEIIQALSRMGGFQYTIRDSLIIIK